MKKIVEPALLVKFLSFSGKVDPHLFAAPFQGFLKIDPPIFRFLVGIVKGREYESFRNDSACDEFIAVCDEHFGLICRA